MAPFINLGNNCYKRLPFLWQENIMADLQGNCTICSDILAPDTEMFIQLLLLSFLVFYSYKSLKHVKA